ncbi:MAG: LLM class flavin-dependent oxidoreductase [Dehalococcoidia bacterium]
MKFSLGPYLSGATDLYPTLRQHAALAEEEGFDSIWIEPGNQSCGASPFVVGAWVARQTKALRIAVRPVVGLVHPLYAAEDAAALDLISNGRLLFAPLAPSPTQAAVYALDPNQARAAFWESLEVLPRAWSPEPFQHSGERWRIPAHVGGNREVAAVAEVSVTPKPAQTIVPIWLEEIADQSLPAPVVQVAGRSTPVEEIAERLRPRDGCVPTVRALLRDVVVAETEQEAANLSRLLEGSDRRCLICGDVEQVVAQLQGLRDAGANYLVCRIALSGLSPEESLNSLRLLARAVAPRFRMASFPGEIRVHTIEETQSPVIGYLREGAAI